MSYNIALQAAGGVKPPRDTCLDSWRGLFHIVMLTDHIPVLFPGVFTLVAVLLEALGYVSVAEGFVFLSGYVTGLVYMRVWLEQGERAMRRKAVLRAIVIYATYVAGVVSLLFLKSLGGPTLAYVDAWKHLMKEPLLTATLQTTALLWQPTFLDILPMYSLFLLLAPSIIKQLQQGRCWLVAGISILVWALNLWGIRARLLYWLGLDPTIFGYFGSFAWQILFVGGLICGHRSVVIKGSWLPGGWGLPVFAYVTVIFLFGLRHELVGISLSESWTQRSSLGPVRLLNFACFAFLAGRFRKPIARWLKWEGLAFLSRQSLQVFSFHLIPVYVAWLFVADRKTIPWWMQLLFVAVCILGLFLIARLSLEIKRIYSVKRSKTDQEVAHPVCEKHSGP